MTFGAWLEDAESQGENRRARRRRPLRHGPGSPPNMHWTIRKIGTSVVLCVWTWTTMSYGGDWTRVGGISKARGRSC